MKVAFLPAFWRRRVSPDEIWKSSKALKLPVLCQHLYHCPGGLKEQCFDYHRRQIVFTIERNFCRFLWIVFLVPTLSWTATLSCLPLHLSMKASQVTTAFLWYWHSACASQNSYEIWEYCLQECSLALGTVYTPGKKYTRKTVPAILFFAVDQPFVPLKISMPKTTRLSLGNL